MADEPKTRLDAQQHPTDTGGDDLGKTAKDAKPPIKADTGKTVESSPPWEALATTRKDDLPAQDAPEAKTVPAAAEPVEEALRDADAPPDAATDDAAISEPGPVRGPVRKISQPHEKPRRNGLFPALLGGVIAAALGYVAGQGGFPGTGPSGAQITALQGDVAALETTVKEQGQALPDLAPLITRLEALEAADQSTGTAVQGLAGDTQTAVDAIAALGVRLAAVDARLTALEKKPVTDNAPREAIAAYERELSALTDRIGGIREEVEALLTEARAYEASARNQRSAADAAATMAAQEGALARLRAAAASGVPFADAVAAAAALGVTAPANVTGAAEQGIASLATLTGLFPDAARAALAAARAGTRSGEGLRGYIQRQLGARSTQPRAGDDPDAVLSRAEAAVRTGELSRAIALIATLPKDAQAALADWTDKASTRIAVLAAIDGMTPRNAN